MTANYQVFRGQRSADAIDFSTAVGLATGSPPVAEMARLGHVRGRRYCYAARAAGAEIEHNTHVLARVEVGPDGSLLPPPLPTPCGLRAIATPSGRARLTFALPLPPGFAAPDAVEIVSAPAGGTFDLERPLAVLRPRPPWPARFDLLVPCPDADTGFAVRSRRGGRAGPLGRAVRVPFDPPRAIEPFEVTT